MKKNFKNILYVIAFLSGCYALYLAVTIAFWIGLFLTLGGLGYLLYTFLFRKSRV